MVSLGLVRYMGLWVTGTGGLKAGLLLPAGVLIVMLLLLPLVIVVGTLGAMIVAVWPMSPPLTPPATKALLSRLV